ncbi:aldo/keto reductase [Streptomyces sp. MN03-5084-2B]|nr:aldo/keto reductase [Streptomyces sp. MN03-5084-2B]
MPETKLADDFYVSTLGLGCASMSHGYGPANRDDEESTRVIHRAIELGVTLFDTADVYGPFTNEYLLGRALRGHRDEVTIASKCGLVARADGKLSRNGRPESLRAACAGSLRRLRVDTIDLYQLHRVDPAVPLAETWGALADMVTEGKLRGLGISHATVEELDLIHAIHPLTAVQYELSILATDNLRDILPWCRANNVGFLAFAPIGRGFLSGKIASGGLVDGDSRIRDPRFEEEAMRANETILDGLRVVCARHGATPAQVAIAWTLAQGENVVPIPGTRKRRWLEENVAAAELRLSREDLAYLDGMPPAMGKMHWEAARSTDSTRAGATT